MLFCIQITCAYRVIVEASPTRQRVIQSLDIQLTRGQTARHRERARVLHGWQSHTPNSTSDSSSTRMFSECVIADWSCRFLNLPLIECGTIRKGSHTTVSAQKVSLRLSHFRRPDDLKHCMPPGATERNRKYLNDNRSIGNAAWTIFVP